MGDYKGTRPPGAEMEAKNLAPSLIVPLTDDTTYSKPDFHAAAFLKENHLFSWDLNDTYV